MKLTNESCGCYVGLVIDGSGEVSHRAMLRGAPHPPTMPPISSFHFRLAHQKDHSTIQHIERTSIFLLPFHYLLKNEGKIKN